MDVPLITLSDDQWEETRKGLLRPYMYTENEPLYHTGIYMTESANYLFLDIAHIMGDGMTMNVLFEDINAIYAGKQVKKRNIHFMNIFWMKKNGMPEVSGRKMKLILQT